MEEKHVNTDNDEIRTMRAVTFVDCLGAFQAFEYSTTH